MIRSRFVNAVLFGIGLTYAGTGLFLALHAFDRYYAVNYGYRFWLFLLVLVVLAAWCVSGALHNRAHSHDTPAPALTALRLVTIAVLWAGTFAVAALVFGALLDATGVLGPAIGLRLVTVGSAGAVYLAVASTFIASWAGLMSLRSRD